MSTSNSKPADVKLTMHVATRQWLKRIGKTKTKAGKVVPKSFYFGEHFATAQHRAFGKIQEWADWERLAREAGFTGELTWENAPLLSDPYHGVGLPADSGKPAASPYGDDKPTFADDVDDTAPTAEAAVDDVTLSKVRQWYLAEQKRRVGLMGTMGIKQHTYYILERTLDRALAFWPDGKLLSSVGADAMRDVVFHFAARPERLDAKVRAKSGLSTRLESKTAIDILRTLKAFFVWASEQEGINYTLPKVFNKLFRVKPEADERRIKPFTTAQIKAMMDAAVNMKCHRVEKGEKRKLYLLLGLNCGFTQSEIGSLRRDDVFLNDAEPHIERIRQKTKNKNHFRTRYVLWPETAELLRRYLEPKNKHGLALLNENGKPLVNLDSHINNVTMAFERMLKSSEDESIKIARFKDLRKTGATAIQRIGGEDVCRMYLAHSRKGMIDAYTEPDYSKLTAALKAYRAELLAAGVMVETVTPAKPAVAA